MSGRSSICSEPQQACQRSDGRPAARIEPAGTKQPDFAVGNEGREHRADATARLDFRCFIGFAQEYRHGSRPQREFQRIIDGTRLRIYFRPRFGATEKQRGFHQCRRASRENPASRSISQTRVASDNA